MARKTPIRLGLAQNARLIQWMTENLADITQLALSRAEIAERAARALDLPVNDNHITYIIAECDAFESLRGRRRGPRADSDQSQQVAETLTEVLMRVERIEALLSKLVAKIAPGQRDLFDGEEGAAA